MSRGKCFVLASVGSEEVSPELRREKDALKRIIANICTNREIDIDPVYADEISEGGAVCDEVIDCLCSETLCIFDLTGLEPNVMYALGIRQQTSKPYITIAKKTQKFPSATHYGKETFFFEDITTDYDKREQFEDSLMASIKAQMEKHQGGVAVASVTNSDIMAQLIELTTVIKSVKEKADSQLSDLSGGGRVGGESFSSPLTTREIEQLYPAIEESELFKSDVNDEVVTEVPDILLEEFNEIDETKPTVEIVSQDEEILEEIADLVLEEFNELEREVIKDSDDQSDVYQEIIVDKDITAVNEEYNEIEESEKFEGISDTTPEIKTDILYKDKENSQEKNHEEESAQTPETVKLVKSDNSEKPKEKAKSNPYIIIEEYDEEENSKIEIANSFFAEQEEYHEEDNVELSQELYDELLKQAKKNKAALKAEKKAKTNANSLLEEILNCTPAPVKVKIESDKFEREKISPQKEAVKTLAETEREIIDTMLKRKGRTPKVMLAHSLQEKDIITVDMLLRSYPELSNETSLLAGTSVGSLYCAEQIEKIIDEILTSGNFNRIVNAIGSLANCFVINGICERKFTSFEGWIERAVKNSTLTNKQKAAILSQKVNMLEGADKLDEAIQIYEDILELDNEEPRYYYTAASLLNCKEDTGSKDRKLAYVNKMFELDKTGEIDFLTLGYMILRESELEKDKAKSKAILNVLEKLAPSTAMAFSR